MDTASFITNIKTWNIFVYIAIDVKTRFDTSNYKTDTPLPKGIFFFFFFLINGRWIKTEK